MCPLVSFQMRHSLTVVTGWALLRSIYKRSCPCSLHILGINIEKGKLKLSELPGKGFAVGETLRRTESRLPADGPRPSQEGGQLPASLRAAARCRAADAAGR